MADRVPPGFSRSVRSLAILTCALLIYYGVPLQTIESASDVVRLALFVVGVVGLVWLLVHQIRRYADQPTDTGIRVTGVLAILYLVVVVFAFSYYLIESLAPGQFDGLETRTDALYFTVVTLGTVGYGDVNAAGQLARVATMVQVTFDLVLVGLLLSVASSHIAQRLASARERGARRRG